MSEFTDLQAEIHHIAVEHGWWDERRSVGDIAALFHSEVSEFLEAYRHGNPMSKHCPMLTSMDEELADIVIRVMDYAEANGVDLLRAIETKTAFNRTRPYKHGGKML